MNFEALLDISLLEDLTLFQKSPETQDDILELFPEEEESLFKMYSFTFENSAMDFYDCPVQENLFVKVKGEDTQAEKPEDEAGINLKTTPRKAKGMESTKEKKKKQNSPFHNYQKHLNNGLKKLITLPNASPSDEDYKLAARELWKVYTTGEVKTKKILHFVFNERNAYMINDCELRAYGLLDIYKKYGSSVILRAKNYLSELAVDQIDERSIESYLKGRRLRKSEGFTDYILSFRGELEEGFIKRRVHSE